MSSRRGFLQNFLAGAGIFASVRVLSAQEASMSHGIEGTLTKRQRETGASEHGGGIPVPAQTPDVPDLPFRMDGNVKEFHLIAEPVKQEIIPGRAVDLWGDNGSAPGPTIQITRGDRVRVIVEKPIPEATSMNWHGV